MLGLASVLLALAGVAHADEWRAAAGGELNADSHGIADFVVRGEDWQAGLLTDTLDGRWTPEGDRGKAWVGLRLAGFAAGLQISPWTDGAPDPGRSLIAGYVGPELGVQRYLGKGVYAGLEGHVRGYAFAAMPDTTRSVPGPRLVARTDAVLGWWTEAAAVKLVPGAHLAPGAGAVVQPHVLGEARWTPAWTVHPRVELRAGWAQGQDDVTRTRLGGLNPYVVPLAGAAWAEWWVEDYAAARLGPELVTDPFELALLVDLAAFSDRFAPDRFDGRAVGLAIDTRSSWRRLFLDLDLGYAPSIPRPGGHGRVSVWLALGFDWGSFAPAR